jgi:aspartyl-tRNA(Asn)/glutamyl-tRNA(Gln) amidotransferase subunit A
MNNLPLTISETQELLKNKEITAVQLVDKYLAQINKLNPDLNALITITDEYAYQEAKKRDLLIQNNPDAFDQFPLLGVVISLKDIYSTKGIHTTAASKILESYIPQYSATAVKKLEDAGAIIIAKANCDAWAHGSSGENSDFGPTKNPHNTDYVPGGSSSGSAVSVASQMSLASMGTDTGGSIRLPASFTNTVGLKPSYGAVSRYGVIAMASSLDSIGHFTHTVEDSRKIFNVTSGIDGFDSTVSDREPTSPKQSEGMSKLKIGIPKEYFVEGLDKEIKAKIDEVIKLYKDLDIEFVEVSLPHTKYAISTYYIIQPAEVSSNLARYDAVRFGNERNNFGKEAKRRIMLGTHVLSSGYYDAYYLKAMKVRTLIREDYTKAFQEIDALIAPVSPTLPFKLGEKSSDPMAMYLADIYTVAINLAGLPAISIPCGFSQNGLPIGFQLIAPHFEEKTLFDLGELYQSKTNFHLQTPKL